MGLFGPPNIDKMKTKRDVKGLIKALGYQNEAGMRSSAAEALGKISDTRAVEPLIAALKDSEKDVRKTAAEALGKIGDARAIEPLIAALKDSDVHYAAAIALGQMGDARAIVPLIAALKKENTSAVGALVKIGTPAIEPLITALKGSYWNVRMEAVRALGLIGDARAVEPLISDALKYGEGNVRKAAADALAKIGAPAVEPLIAALKDSDSAVRTAAAEALNKMCWRPGRDENGAAYWVAKGEWNKCIEIGTPAVKPLITALKDSDSAVRKAAEDALNKMGWRPGRDENGADYWIFKREWEKCIEIGAPAVKPLIAALKDVDRNVHKAATEVLVKIGTPAVALLIAALKDSKEHVRKTAAEALGQIGDARAIEPLIAALKDSKEHVRKEAVSALGQIGDARAVEPLITAFKDSDKDVREATTEVLVKIGKPAVEPLIAALKNSDPDIRKETVEALGQIGDARAVEPLIAALKDSKEHVRKAVAETLDKMGWRPGRDENGGAYWIAKLYWDKCIEMGTPAVEPLIAALNSGLSNAAYALGQIGDARAVEPLIAALNSGAREAAAGALAKIGDARAVEPLIAALKDKHEDVRKAAAVALGQIGDARAIAPLITALTDSKWSVRRDVAESLINLYQSGLLDKAHTSLILAQRGNIFADHNDTTIESHTDDNTCGFTIYGESRHIDHGIGVAFPV